MVQPPRQARRDNAEDLWLVCHEMWLKPLEWLTAWWDTFIVPASWHPHFARANDRSGTAPGPVQTDRGRFQGESLRLSDPKNGDPS